MTTTFIVLLIVAAAAVVPIAVACDSWSRPKSAGSQRLPSRQQTTAHDSQSARRRDRHTGSMRRPARTAAARRFDGLGRQQAPQPAAIRQQPSKSGSELDASKAIGTLERVLSTYGRALPWTNGNSRGDFVHDIAMMRKHGDLRRIDIELMDRSGAIVYRHRISFDGEMCRIAVHNLGGGLELPVLPHGTVADNRLVVIRRGNDSAYCSELRLSWKSAEQRVERCSDRFTSEHTARINGGKAHGEIAVTGDARHTALIHKVCDQGRFAFVRHTDFPGDIYLEEKFRIGSFRFQPGLRVSFVVVQTLLGLQARNIRLA